MIIYKIWSKKDQMYMPKSMDKWSATWFADKESVERHARLLLKVPGNEADNFEIHPYLITETRTEEYVP